MRRPPVPTSDSLFYPGSLLVRTAAPAAPDVVIRRAEAKLELRSDDLPEGVCGRISGVALTFDTVDSYGTMFAPGCAARSIGQRVAARKVPVLMDHNRSAESHVGVVSSMTEVGASYAATVDIFNTQSGKRALEYVKAVLASGASTGFSVGFVPRKWDAVTVEGKTVERFTEIELRELSLTPMPAVPGADVTTARNDAAAGGGNTAPETDPLAEVRDDVNILVIAARAALDALPAEARADLLKTYTPAPSADGSATDSTNRSATPPATAPVEKQIVTMEDRVRAVRQTFTPPTTK